jgi:hypothetical protein
MTFSKLFNFLRSRLAERSLGQLSTGFDGVKTADFRCAQVLEFPHPLHEFKKVLP